MMNKNCPEFLLPDCEVAPEALIAKAQDEGVSLFGCGNYAKDVFAALHRLGISVHAFCVTNKKEESFLGVPVLTLAELGDTLSGIPMWIAVHNRDRNSDLVELRKTCHDAGIHRVLLPQEYYETIQDQLGWRYWLTDRRRYKERVSELKKAYTSLSDDESRSQFQATLEFRLRGTLQPPPSFEPQYLTAGIRDALTKRSNNSICYVDGGAYDGDSLEFIGSNICLTRAFAFEPAPGNFARLSRNSRKLGFPICCYPCGLSNSTAVLPFSPDSTEASSLMDTGSSHVQVVCLDDCLIGQQVDYIKLDIEGHELQALEGARNIIGRDRPVLAIAAYHKADDLWQIPNFLISLNLGYKLTYRTHEHNSFDSVLYACPS